MNKTAHQLYNDLKEAKGYLAKIGRAQSHFDDRRTGELVSLTAATKICHQEYSGATNYWQDEEFDAAFAKAAREHFANLAKRAIEIMTANAEDALLSEKVALEARLSQIRDIEAAREVVSAKA